jgi:hypothetical protein
MKCKHGNIGECHECTIWKLQQRVARVTEISIDLANRLRLRIPDDIKAWPGDRSVLLEHDILMSDIYKQDVLKK